MATVEDKQQIVEGITNKIKGASGLYLADFTGINVELVTGLRATFREKGITMVVVKNTLLKRVFDKCKISGLDDYLIGPTSLILGSEEDPIEPAKVITQFHKKNKGLFQVKAARIETENFSGSRLVELSNMPGRRESLGQVVSIILGPASNLINIIMGSGSTIAGQVNNLIEKLEKNN